MLQVIKPHKIKLTASEKSRLYVCLIPMGDKSCTINQLINYLINALVMELYLLFNRSIKDNLSTIFFFNIHLLFNPWVIGTLF